MIPQSRRDVHSWGLHSSGEHVVSKPSSRADSLPVSPGSETTLPFGNGRSYGDSCLNVGQGLLDAKALDHFLDFDPQSGSITCEGGVLLDAVLDVVMPRGWFLPVVPGTRYVTVGGAIANDVHGKNHHRAGTFGSHVEQFELLRSSGERLLCSAISHPELYCATIGGLGLTGLIVWAKLRLVRVPSLWLQVESKRFDSLTEFSELSEQAEATFEHVVAWVDAGGRSPGRGVLICANWAAYGARPPVPKSAAQMPFTPPVSLVGPLVTRAFNTAYFHRVPKRGTTALTHAYPFFFPLDGINDWNRMYGPRGFYQYQCAIPQADALTTVAALLKRIAANGQGSFLSVLKRFGAAESPGLLSFPLPGWTLALDFPNLGKRTLDLFQAMDDLVRSAGGRLYPAKDARMGAAMFRQSYPALSTFSKSVDPHFSSSFWRRVNSL